MSDDVELLSWLPVRRGTLRGFATVRLAGVADWHDIAIHTHAGRAWASLPSVIVVAGIVNRARQLWATPEASRECAAAVITALVAREWGETASRPAQPTNRHTGGEDPCDRKPN